ncbi:hypothetical protein D3C87_24360 [compost metagenome]
MNNIFCLLKFGQEKYLRSLIDGELYFNTVEHYVNSDKDQVGDPNEGCVWIENGQFTSIKANHPTLGFHEFKPVPNRLGKLSQSNLNFLSCSFFAITPNVFTESDTFIIDNRISEFGTHALMINEPCKFLGDVANELKLQNIEYEIDIVKYRDFNTEGRIELTPFDKSNDYSHQHELRIIRRNVDNQAKTVSIGSIADYVEITETKYFLETVWSAKRK